MEKDCKQETMKEEVKEHVQLWRKPKFRQAVERKIKGPRSERKGMSKR